ncbi:MAG: 4Fe-4S binding protein [Candidatus Omnitrophica bacterium]|nr:4Fe-4S binding protein [Candidatus Omnitrophota bacterium]
MRIINFKKIQKLALIRKTVQVFFLGIFVYILWSTTYPLTGKIPPEIIFKADPLIMIATALSERLLLGGLLFCAVLSIAAFIIGRYFCGWICPMGTVIDFIGWFNNAKKLERFKRINLKLRELKFYLLGAIILLALPGVQAAWLFDPIVIISRFVSLNFIPAVTALINGFFIWIIQSSGMYGWLLDIYRDLKVSLLGVNVYFFSHAWMVFLCFLAVSMPALLVLRFWCRLLCPLGALYALFGRHSLLSRNVKGCIFCRRCADICPMAAINQDMAYEKQECILCMKCVYGCPQAATSFSFSKKGGSCGGKPNAENNVKGISRRQLLTLLACGLGAEIFTKKIKTKSRESENIYVIRPPLALKEEEFLNRCVRCGNCMKVCPTNGLQPAFLQAGILGLWTPILVADIGYCEYNCTLCSQVCPTAAIPKVLLKVKQKKKLGIAKIDRGLCLPWAKQKECLVCEEHCPISQKAIKLRKSSFNKQVLLKPYIDEELCIGCGICQAKCPVTPARAVKIFAINSDRG